MDNFDSILESQLQNDKLNTKPSEAIFNYLHNQMLVNSATTKLKQNSFIPPFTSIVGKTNLAWKISIAAVLLISFMGIKHMNQNNIYIQTADSTFAHQHLDTLNFQLADSSLIY
ncbi:MAG: hypothetical protein PF517_19195 [Salinivirgaceae bacterium]|jgi:hypothetical protein|nr:hypothetical protein [Salinivirgaceae bacterium]